MPEQTSMIEQIADSSARTEMWPSQEEELILREHAATRKLFQHRTDEILKVMARHQEAQKEKTQELLERMGQLQKESKELNELKKQILLTRNALPQVFMVAFALMALGFFSAGFIFTDAKILFLFFIFGALAWVIPGMLSLSLPRKRGTKKD